MYRRVVEATACDKLGADAKDDKGKTKKLFALIDAMHAKGLITTDVKDSAHGIRHFGNYGAHVQDDGLESVSAEEANDVAQVAWQLLQSLYIAPAKTAELRNAKRRRRRSPGAE